MHDINPFDLVHEQMDKGVAFGMCETKNCRWKQAHIVILIWSTQHGIMLEYFPCVCAVYKLS